MDIDFEPLLELIYDKIHSFLSERLGEDLNSDMIDIEIESKESGEIVVNIDLYLEIQPFSSHDIEKLASEAVEDGIIVADKVCPNLVIRLKSMNHKRTPL